MQNSVSNKIIALITDFGTLDAYAGVLKAILLQFNPALSIIDITHEINPFSIESASFILYSCWDYFPKGTIFLSVVDPGVGSKRNILLAEQNGKILIAPDNGSITLLYNKKKNFKVWTPSLRVLSLIPPPAGSTFHGRDIFAPLAGLTSLKGIEEMAGEKLSPILLKSLQPVVDRKAHSLTGKIIHIDRFGNCISAICINDFLALTKPDNKKTATIRAGKIKIKGIMDYFSQVSKGVPLSYFGSTGFLEIAVNTGNASEVLKIKMGDKVSVYY